MAQETDAGTIWLNNSAMAVYEEYKEELESDAKAEQKPHQVVESACKTALEVEG